MDPLIQKYLKATRYNGGVVNTMVKIVTAKALAKRCPLLEKDHFELGQSWAQSIVCRLNFIHRQNEESSWGSKRSSTEVLRSNGQ